MAYSAIPIGDTAPEIINVVIEIPRGTSNKYEYDETLDEIMLDRVLHSPLLYPIDYGFIPHTRSEDGDHLDCMVLLSQPVFPGCVVQVRPIAALDMEDEGGQDWKILAVACHDPRSTHITSLAEANKHTLREIEHFFESYKHLEDKWAKVKGWESEERALWLITQAQQRYSQETH